MTRLLLTIFLFACAATPLIAQDIDLGLAGDASSLLNIAAPRGNQPARGNAPNRGASPGTPAVDRLVRLRELLAQSNVPLSPEQQTSLAALLNAEIPAMRQNLQKRVQAAASPPTMEELTPEIVHLNDQLLAKIAEAPALTEEQRRIVKKVYKDQVKARGGFDAIRLTMEDAGAAFSADQMAQIPPLFDQQNEARLQLIKDSQGQPPDKAKLDALQRDTLAKVLKLLTPAQRAALLAK